MNQAGYSLKQILWLCVALIGCLTIMGCIQSQSMASTQSSASRHAQGQAIKLVNQAFYQSFRAGDWYYQGAEKQGSGINAYIQIPAALDMPQDTQVKYIKQAICPSKTNEAMWYQLKKEDKPLAVHIYTFSKRHTVYAECDNPLV